MGKSKRKEAPIMSHTATATNWNGKTLHIDFKAGTTSHRPKLDELAKRAHAAFHRAGFTTIRLDLIDGESIPYAFQYAR